MEPEAQIRNLRDFLMVYNRMTEICFHRCTTNLNYRTLTMDEERCVDSCAGKLIRSNHRLMGTYVNLMPGMMQRRVAEMEKKNAELAGAGGAGGVLEGAGEGGAGEGGAGGVLEGAGMGELPPVRSTSNAVSDVIPIVAPPTTTPGLADARLPVAPTPGDAQVPPTTSFSPAPPPR
ncbi:hypothetical protein DPEC_G00230230 [Dallia pectoralis]|uniref:Uncharacterized protein n=1 Tax=Dallia pectoralis TaxID=75939 RepID=A0ACC2G1T2_DALPE|nr:hypothetical protein DPEC_G00230230 [Dallia pectoralis]